MPCREFDLDKFLEKCSKIKQKRDPQGCVKDCLREMQKIVRKEIWTFLEQNSIMNCRRVHALIRRDFRKRGRIYTTTGKVYLNFRYEEHGFIQKERDFTLPSGPGNNFDDFSERTQYRLNRICAGWKEAEQLVGLSHQLTWENHMLEFTWNETN